MGAASSMINIDVYISYPEKKNINIDSLKNNLQSFNYNIFDNTQTDIYYTLKNDIYYTWKNNIKKWNYTSLPQIKCMLKNYPTNKLHYII